MNKLILLTALVILSAKAVINRDAAWTGMPQRTMAQRIATKYDAQARINRFASGGRFLRVPLRPHGPDYGPAPLREPRRPYTTDISPDYFGQSYSTQRHDATNVAPEHIGID
jgi:hypothetical protein